MRYLNMLFCLSMIGFAGVQYNDPDTLLWAFYYGVPAVWAGLAAFRIDLLRSPVPGRLLQASVVVWLGLVIFYWPQMPKFWVKEVFMAEETAREGMGLMIAWLVVVSVALTARFSRPATSGNAVAKHAQA